MIGDTQGQAANDVDLGSVRLQGRRKIDPDQKAAGTFFYEVGNIVESEERKPRWVSWDAKDDSYISGAVDFVAFQDGHVNYDQLYDFIYINKELADKNNIKSWINTETFDRDMPIKFLPIKWDKLKFKLDTAYNAGIQEAITFEFSHFMSPQSSYLQAGHLYNRYMDYLKS